MAQIARDYRKISPDIVAQVLVRIEQKFNDWNVRLSKMTAGGGIGLLSLVRYLKFQLALYQIRRGLTGL
jgi:hypothetical protein